MALRQGARSPARPLTTRSDARGTFALALGGPGTYDVRVEAAGLAPYEARKLAVPGAALAVTLGKGAVIEGVVKDARGRPVTGARVEARDPRAWPATTGADAETGRIVATSGAQGAFRLEGVGNTAQVVTASARGVGAARRSGVRPGQRLEMFLAAGAAI